MELLQIVNAGYVLQIIKFGNVSHSKGKLLKKDRSWLKTSNSVSIVYQMDIKSNLASLKALVVMMVVVGDIILYYILKRKKKKLMMLQNYKVGLVQ